MKSIRIAVGVLGLLMMVIGGRYLWDLGTDNGEAAVSWLVGGVVLHDFVLSPLLLVAGLLLVRQVPAWLRGPLVAGLTVLGTATVVGFPMLGRFGERRDNPSLLDRNYTGAGWCSPPWWRSAFSRGPCGVGRGLLRPWQLPTMRSIPMKRMTGERTH
jgi:hypothetical protein